MSTDANVAIGDVEKAIRASFEWERAKITEISEGFFVTENHGDFSKNDESILWEPVEPEIPLLENGAMVEILLDSAGWTVCTVNSVKMYSGAFKSFTVKDDDTRYRADQYQELWRLPQAEISDALLEGHYFLCEGKHAMSTKVKDGMRIWQFKEGKWPEAATIDKRLADPVCTQVLRSPSLVTLTRFVLVFHRRRLATHHWRTQRSDCCPR